MDRLSAAEIARVTHFHPSALKRYLSVPANRMLLGVADDPPTYPAENLPLFRRLKELDDAGMVKQSTLEALWPVLFSPEAIGVASGSLAELRPATPSGLQTDPRSLVPSAQVPMGQFQCMITAAFVSALEQTVQTEPADELLTTQGVAEVLKCDPGSIKRFTRGALLPCRRGFYLSSAVQDYLRSLKR